MSGSLRFHPTERDDDAPVFDPARLKAVLGFLPTGQLREFALLYLEDAADCANRIVVLAAEGDSGAVARAAHQLVGIAGNYGAMETSRLARTLETAGKAGDEASCRRLAPLLPAATERAASWLRAWLDDAYPRVHRQIRTWRRPAAERDRVRYSA